MCFIATNALSSQGYEVRHGQSTSHVALPKRKAAVAEPAPSEEVRAEGSKRPRCESDVGAVVFNIKDDSSRAGSLAAVELLPAGLEVLKARMRE